MEQTLLFVLHAVLRSDMQISSILRMMRQTRPAGSGYALLLFCDLPDAGAAILPGDAPMLRQLQSGVMSMNARSGGFMMLARRRAWNDAQRAYLGENQPLSYQRVIAQLLVRGETDAVFDAATVSPESLKDRFSHVLFSEISLSCTPDTPMRMLEALKDSPSGCIGARVLEKRSFPQTALARLLSFSPFSLSPLLSARYDRLQRKGQTLPDAPVLCAAEALSASLDTPGDAPPAAQGCFFVRRHSVTLPDFFAATRQRMLSDSRLHALLPVLQVILLFAGAAWGRPWLAALALLPMELWALLHPRLLPGALLRLSLLPLTACVTLDALLCRLFARSSLLRLRVPASFIAPQICVLWGAALLSAAMYGAQALAVYLPVSLLWLAAPLMMIAIDKPTIERIPLDGEQKKQMRTLAESAFFDSETRDTAPPMRILALCSGCMLGILEPDEAARRIEKQLDAPPPGKLSASGLAAMLCAAQYLREQMKDCDAALRKLPEKIESFALAYPLEKTASRLGLFLAAARGDISPAQTDSRLSKPDTPEPPDLLFLPLQSAKASPVYPISLPLTHPHTFLRRQLLAKDAPVFLPEPSSRVLFLTAAALDHPFYALLERSPITGPFMPLLLI